MWCIYKLSWITLIVSCEFKLFTFLILYI
jgi:hypothetical protein